MYSLELELPSFGGDILHYPSFIECFQAAIGKNENIADTLKMLYLQDCLEGLPKELLRHMPITESSYKEALSLLEDNFGCTTLRRQTVLKKIENLKPINSVEPILPVKKLLADVRCLLQMLKQVDVNLEEPDSYLFGTIISKFPYEMTMFFRRQTPEEKWTVLHLVNFLIGDVLICERAEFGTKTHEENLTQNMNYHKPSSVRKSGKKKISKAGRTCKINLPANEILKKSTRPLDSVFREDNLTREGMQQDSPSYKRTFEEKKTLRKEVKTMKLKDTKQQTESSDLTIEDWFTERMKTPNFETESQPKVESKKEEISNSNEPCLELTKDILVEEEEESLIYNENEQVLVQQELISSTNWQPNDNEKIEFLTDVTNFNEDYLLQHDTGLLTETKELLLSQEEKPTLALQEIKKMKSITEEVLKSTGISSTLQQNEVIQEKLEQDYNKTLRNKKLLLKGWRL